jgi:hypothetical protein
MAKYCTASLKRQMKKTIVETDRDIPKIVVVLISSESEYSLFCGFLMSEIA